MLFAQKKLAQRKLQAARENVLIATEDSADLQEAAAAQQNVLAERHLKRQKEACKREQELAGTKPLMAELRGSCAYVEKPAWAPLLCAWSMQRVAGVCNAAVMIMANPATHDAASKALWAAVLRGRLCLSHRWLEGAEGPAVKFKPALATYRRVYISARFQERRRQMYELIKTCASDLGRDNKWKFIELHEFQQPVAGQNFKIGLVTRAEKQERRARSQSVSVSV